MMLLLWVSTLTCELSMNSVVDVEVITCEVSMNDVIVVGVNSNL